MTIFFSKFPDVRRWMSTIHARPDGSHFVVTWTPRDGRWEQSELVDVGTLEAAVELKPVATPWIDVPPTFAVGAWGRV